ncbi:MAG: 3-phosphoshikimate 1-carboxyvinyltransferase, partial [Thermoproteota archaeon]|nr:3-phosphoshikimate 1-carboxyvinyltransferase [Thermoproteota archaeon]
MRINIQRSNLHGEIQCPPSKSYTHRAFVISSLASGKSQLSNVLLSRDTRATMNCCRLLGVEIHNDNSSIVKDHRANVIVNSKGGKSGFLTPNDVLPADNSGTTIRLLTSLCALVTQGYSVLTGDDSLRKRPMRDLIKSLNQLGVDCFSTNSSFFPPVIVKGGGIEGGKTQINGGISSQFISSLLLSGVYSKKGVTIEVLGKQVSKPYIESTIHIMRYFGVNIQNDVNDSIDEISEQSNLTESKSDTSIDNLVTESYTIPPNLSYKPREFSVPGDFSTAALLISAAFLSRGQLTIKGLNFDMPQGDMEIIDIVKSMGGHVSTDRIKGTATVDGNSSLSGGVFDLRKTPDLLPVLAVLSLVAKGTTRI